MLRCKATGLVLALVLALSVVAGCAGPVATPTTAPAAQQAENQVLRINLGEEPPTLDPTMVEESLASTIMDATQQGLVRFNHDLTVEAALAENWEISPDGKVFTFKLRDDIKYSDGTPIEAEDFVYSWKRLLDPRTGAGYASLLSNVKGAAAFAAVELPNELAKLPELESALGISAPDSKTFKVELNGPSTYFLSICAMANTVPLRQEVIDEHGPQWTEAENYITTGPFMVKSWEHQSKIVLVPNPHYYGEKPILSEIQLAMIGDDKAEFEAYKAGELDICNRVPAADTPAVREDPALKNEIVQSASMGTCYINFNTNKPPFDNELVRQAFASAIDREALVEVTAQGIDTPATSFIPPGLFGHQSDLGYKFDVEKAQQYLADAGYPDGQDFPEVTLMYHSPPVPGFKTQMEFVQDQLKTNLNVPVKVEALEWGAFLDKCMHDAPDMFRLSWGADFPHPYNFLDVAFRSTSGNNFTGWGNAEYDALLDQAAVTADQTKQEELYKQAQAIFIEEAPIIPISFAGRFQLAKPWVENLTGTPQDKTLGGLFFDEVSIAAH